MCVVYETPAGACVKMSVKYLDWIMSVICRKCSLMCRYGYIATTLNTSLGLENLIIFTQKQFSLYAVLRNSQNLVELINPERNIYSGFTTE